MEYAVAAARYLITADFPVARLTTGRLFSPLTSDYSTACQHHPVEPTASTPHDAVQDFIVAWIYDATTAIARLCISLDLDPSQADNPR